jgi:hypothetical protein
MSSCEWVHPSRAVLQKIRALTPSDALLYPLTPLFFHQFDCDDEARARRDELRVNAHAHYAAWLDAIDENA